MKKIRIVEVAGLTVVSIFLGTWLVSEEIFKFFSKYRLKKITKMEELGDTLIFKSDHQQLFALKKHGIYAVDISNYVISFTYFGCASQNDFHTFRITHGISGRLKDILTPSDFMYEQGLYRFR